MLFLLLCSTMIVINDNSEKRIHGGRGGGCERRPAATAGAENERAWREGEEK